MILTSGSAGEGGGYGYGFHFGLFVVFFIGLVWFGLFGVWFSFVWVILMVVRGLFSEGSFGFSGVFLLLRCFFCL